MNLAALSLAAFFAAPSWAGKAPQAKQQPSAPAVSPAAVGMPQQAEIINLSLLEALKTIGDNDMAGVFAFIPSPSVPPAMADYLLHRPKSLKKFVKKGEGDLKAAGGINEWDQQVFVYLLNINSSGILPEDLTLSKSMLDRVQKLMLAPAMPLQQITLRRNN